MIALATRERNYDNWTFIDDTRVKTVVKDLELPFVPASVADLAEDLTKADRALIAAHPDVVSAYDMKHWNPQAVREVLFNFWD